MSNTTEEPTATEPTTTEDSSTTTATTAALEEDDDITAAAMITAANASVDEEDSSDDDDTKYDSVLHERKLKREPFDFTTLPADTEVINLSAISWGDDAAAAAAIAERFPNLRVLIATNTSIGDDELEIIAAACTGLRELYLNRSYATTTGIGALAQHCSDLSVIQLSSCVRIDGTALEALGQGCPNLTSLSLSHCSNAINDVAAASIANHFTNLTSLSLRACAALSDTGLSAILSKLSKLTSLDIAFCKNITNDSMTVLADSCPNLLRLDISQTKISDDGLLALANSPCASNLLDLNISVLPLTDVAINALAESCTSLNKVIATKVVRLSPKAVRAFVNTLANLTTANFDSCRTLDLKTQADVKLTARSRRTAAA